MKKLLLIIFTVSLNSVFIACTDNEEILEKEKLQENTELTTECCGDGDIIVPPPPPPKDPKDGN